MNNNTKKRHIPFENPTAKRIRQILERIREMEEKEIRAETFYRLETYSPLSKNFNNITKWLNLTHVNLSNNEINKLPKEFGTLPILHLNLSQNCFGGRNWSWLKESPIRKTLLFLDISNNEIHKLSEHIWNLNALMELNISHNLLERLSQNIGNVRSLKILDVSHNMLPYLPARLLDLQLETIDVTMNPFDFDEICNIEITSLVQLASKILLQHSSFTRYPSIAVEEFTKRNMIETCYHCNKLCIPSYLVAAILLSPDEVARNVIWDMDGSEPSYELLFEFFHCYPKCTVH